MSDIDKKLREIRPSLRIVAPWTFNAILFYGLFNLVIGITLSFSRQTIPFMIHPVGVVGLNGWGAIFSLLGTAMILFLAFNNWRLAKDILLIAISIKVIWFMELIAQASAGESSPFFIFMWTLVLALQVNTYLYFTPERPNDRR